VTHLAELRAHILSTPHQRPRHADAALPLVIEVAGANDRDELPRGRLGEGLAPGRHLPWSRAAQAVLRVVRSPER